MTTFMGPSHGDALVDAVIDIAAPPDAVFRAITDQRELAAWLGGDAAPARHGSDLSGAPSLAMAGQPWRAPAIAPDGSPGSVSGEFLIVDPPRRLESTWRASWDGFAPDRVRFELTPVRVGGVPGTRLRVTHTRANAHLRVTAMASANTSGDWPTLLARLATRFPAPMVGARRTSFGDWT